MRRAALALVLAVLALGLVASGCGGEETAATPETVEGTLPTTENGGGEACEGDACDLEGNAEGGAQVFASSGCGSCHTLAAADSSGTIGPNLDQAKPSYALAVTRITKGRGAMPSFEGQLSAQQIADVAQYVVESTSG
jgi:mono/diheme cytochrome c family protein